MNKPIINGIDVSKYFKNHYDNWGRLYCVEYKGDPLELQNDIKRLQKENEKLKEEKDGMQIVISNYIEHTTKYRQALEKIKNITETPIIADKNRFDEITNKINEVLNDNRD